MSNLISGELHSLQSLLTIKKSVSSPLLCGAKQLFGQLLELRRLVFVCHYGQDRRSCRCFWFFRLLVHPGQSSPAPGVVNKIYVTEGQYVKAGQSLLKFDPDINENRRTTLEQQLKIEQQRFDQQDQAYQARQQSLQARINSQQITLQTEQQIYVQIVPLARVGAIQRVLLKQKTKVEQLKSDIAQSEANLQEVQAELIKLLESLKNISG